MKQRKSIQLEVMADFSHIENNIRSYFYKKYRRLIWFTIYAVKYIVIDYGCISIGRYLVSVAYDETKEDYLGFIYEVKEN